MEWEGHSGSLIEHKEEREMHETKLVGKPQGKRQLRRTCDLMAGFCEHGDEHYDSMKIS
jgi:hypothetical protein